MREALSDEVMERVFMPLMNTKVGFLTDRNGRPRKNGTVQPLYTIPVVRDAIIDAVSIGLLPTGNQFNIIAERMYPTKEGYTALLRKLGVKYFIDVSLTKAKPPDCGGALQNQLHVQRRKKQLRNSGNREEGRLQQPRPNPG